MINLKRISALLFGDIRFQFKYGFYFLYLIFSILYISLLSVLPVDWRSNAAVLMVFTDPGAMGLFFMGSIILFEKSERVLNSIAISPVKPHEYVLSKLFSIAFISIIVGLAIGLFSDTIHNLLYFITGLFLCSCLLSAIGLIIAFNVKTLNQFIIATVPVEIIIMFPAIAYVFGYKKDWLLYHPGVCTIVLFYNSDIAIMTLILLFTWTLIFVMLAINVVKGALKTIGGIKL
jgi:fluoroquinolone transport system permease protein